jgi:hypothetical protein
MKDLDAVVLGRVVGRGNDDAELLGKECDGRSREHAAEHGHASR